MKIHSILVSIFVVAMLIVGLTTPVGATVISYTDLEFGNAITYTLDFSTSNGTDYTATFTVNSTANGSPKEYAGWFMFDTSPGNKEADISSLSAPAGSGPWTIADSGNPNPQVLTGGGNYSSIGGGGASGFYVSSFEQGKGPVVESQALLVTAAKSYTFTFDFSDPNTRLVDMPFQVGYYDGLTGGPHPHIITGRLSEDLIAKKVPEPSTLLLLGSGLLGLGLFGRKKFGA